jgi:hypothetical protein
VHEHYARRGSTRVVPGRARVRENRNKFEYIFSFNRDLFESEKKENERKKY